MRSARSRPSVFVIRAAVHAALVCLAASFAAACGSDSTAGPAADAPDVRQDAGDVGATDPGTDAADVAPNGDASVGDASPDGADAEPGDAGSDAGDVGRDARADATPDADPDTSPPSPCEQIDCGALGVCDPRTLTCRCGAGAWFDGVACAERRECDATDTCDDACPMPRVPVLLQLAASELLRFTLGRDGALEHGWTRALGSMQPDEWRSGDALALSPFEGERVRIFARAAGCQRPMFNAVVEVASHYPPPAGEPGSTAIAADDAAIVAWASRVVDVAFGAGVDEEWRDATAALGPAEGTAFDIVSLGSGGEITLGFERAIADGPGPDIAVFENGFSSRFLEFARVAVSTDGETFVAFDGASLGADVVGPFGESDTRTFGQLAGKYQRGFGDPFDLAALRQHPAVCAGVLDLDDIRFVRVVDIVGDGSESDAFGRPIYDPYPPTGSAGFDLDAVGALHLAEER